MTENQINNGSEETKYCSKCQQDVPLSQWRIVKKTGKPASYCKACEKKYLDEYQKAHPEKMAQIKKNWRLNNAEKHNEQNKASHARVKARKDAAKKKRRAFPPSPRSGSFRRQTVPDSRRSR